MRKETLQVDDPYYDLTLQVYGSQGDMRKGVVRQFPEFEVRPDVPALFVTSPDILAASPDSWRSTPVSWGIIVVCPKGMTDYSLAHCATHAALHILRSDKRASEQGAFNPFLIENDIEEELAYLTGTISSQMNAFLRKFQVKQR